MREETRHLLVIFGAVFLLALTVSAYIFHSGLLRDVGLVVLGFLLVSIAAGVVVALMVKLSKQPLFDPLDSFLDEDPRKRR